jgi:hypothetical protein
MPDVVFIAVILAFFGLCALYIRACDRILQGTEESADSPSEVSS